MKKTAFLLFAAASLSTAMAATDVPGLDPDLIGKPPVDSWSTYSGDFTGQRFSPLTQINEKNVKNLGLAWVNHLSAGPGDRGSADHFGPGNPPTIVGGEIDEPVPVRGAPHISGAVLQVNGILYVSVPDNAWAIDARDGMVLWHYYWKTKGGTHIGNRGMAMYRDWLYFETPDDYLVSLDAKTGKERWHKVISDFDEQYFSTMAPMVLGNHLIVGTGDDLDAPGFLQSFDLETGELQWKWSSEPEKMGDPGSETWPNFDSMRHGGGGPWLPGSYDPQLHLYYFGTANPTPAFSGATRKGANLYTSSIVAVNVDTGKLAWYYQPSPHDTHDWDAAQTPILVDGQFQGKPRKLLLDASRNGYFFVLDRVTGEHLLTVPFADSLNWATGLDATGHPIGNPDKDASPGGVLVSPTSDGIVNWEPPAFDPQTGLFYVSTEEEYSEYYRTEPNVKALQGLNGVQETNVGAKAKYIEAIDYRTGKIAWRRLRVSAGEGGGNTGLTATAGKLLFGGDGNGNLVAWNPADGKPLWHTRLGEVSNAVETYMLDGRQYILVASGISLYAFALNP
jgi:alcohol dehydrogenase (cytochrome c)